ncbi:Uncharacterised protein [Klebsiella pneumoniae]|nr:Uncharacterised protein [Klebsiella pneumoniae]
MVLSQLKNNLPGFDVIMLKQRFYLLMEVAVTH